MINLLNIIIVIQSFLEFIIFFSSQYFEFIISYIKALNLSDIPNSKPYIQDRSFNTKFNNRLYENPNFKDITGCYVYQGFEIF